MPLTVTTKITKLMSREKVINKLIQWKARNHRRKEKQNKLQNTK
jgi:hypothetical protein